MNEYPSMGHSLRDRRKIILIGDQGVGKTSIIKRLFTKGPFETRPTYAISNVNEYNYEFEIKDCEGKTDLRKISISDIFTKEA